MDKALFSNVKNNSKAKDNWRTPKELFDYFYSIWNFQLDLAADDQNHLCKKYFTEYDNSLTQSWGKEPCWLNPPFSMLSEFAEKAIEECQRPQNYWDLFNVHILLPARTDTKYFHRLLPVTYSISFIKGRLKFGDPDGNIVGSAPFPTMVLHLTPSIPDFVRVGSLEFTEKGIKQQWH